MLYTLSKPASYVPNIFEGLKKVAGLDSVANFLYAYNVYKFDPSKSVAGDIVDGKTIYLDSVSTLNNEMLDNLGYLDAEDSTYWMLAPTNEVWNRLVPKYEKYFHFSNGVFSGDPHLRDSLTWTFARQGLIIGSVFNRSLNSRNTDVSFQDSAYATTASNPLYREAIYGDARERYCIFDKPFDPRVSSTVPAAWHAVTACQLRSVQLAHQGSRDLHEKLLYRGREIDQYRLCR